jgi:hypothetical protein
MSSSPLCLEADRLSFITNEMDLVAQQEVDCGMEVTKVHFVECFE